MGAESFFITFIESESQKKLNDIGEYQFLGSVKIPLINFSSINEFNFRLLRLTIFDDSSFLQAVTLEGCFSCYEKCLEELDIVFSQYLSKFNSLMIYDTIENKKIGFSDFNDIKQYILKKYELKFKRYNEIFHCFRKECLPDKQFYKYYRMRKYDNMIKVFKTFIFRN